MDIKKIPVYKVFMPEDLDEILGPLRSVLSSGWIKEGPKVREFENLIGNFIGNKNCIALNSGTSALHLAYHLSDIKPGDEVITTPMTCMAANEPLALMGAKIVWADINPKTGTISAEDIRKKITSKTKAIVMMHWGGYPCDIDEINEIAQENGIKVIEDAAHAIGSEYKGKMIGNYSDFACFSFQAIKTITTGDGGMLVCRNKDDYERANLLKFFGVPQSTDKNKLLGEGDYDIKEAGYKTHMNDIAATIGIAQFKYLENNLKVRRRNAEIYSEELKNVKKLELLEKKDDRKSAYWLYTILVENKDKFMNLLNQNNISCSVGHVRNDTYSMFKEMVNRNLKGVDDFSKRKVCIPVGHWVSESDAYYITDVVKKVLNKI